MTTDSVRRWWAVLPSDDLLGYLQRAHDGADASEVLMSVYLDADEREDVPAAEDGVPFPARKAMQEAIWSECIAPANNEWTTYSDSVALVECAADALHRAGWRVVAWDDGREGAGAA